MWYQERFFLKAQKYSFTAYFVYLAYTAYIALIAYIVKNMPTYIAKWWECFKNVAHNGLQE